jgi:hypothetical protein
MQVRASPSLGLACRLTNLRAQPHPNKPLLGGKCWFPGQKISLQNCHQPCDIPALSANDGTGEPAARSLPQMPDELPSPYAVKVRRYTIHAGRFRWDIHRNGRSVLPSPESLATRQEAETHGRAEAERVVWTAGENRRRGDTARGGISRDLLFLHPAGIPRPQSRAEILPHKNAADRP